MAKRQSGTKGRTHDRRMAWWREARFGMFIHWGLYAIPAGVWKGKEIPGIGEWIMNRARIPVREYEKLASKFNPHRFNASEWVRVAKSAGMKYIAITSKHHDGFAMYHSRASSYNIVDATPFGRDPIQELARECRKAGIRLCFYYSQKQDWHHPQASGNTWDFDPAQQDFNRYAREKGLPQVRELLTQYGPIGLIWYDTPMDITLSQTRKFVNQVYDLQPDCLVNSRAGHGMCDYESMGDNVIPPGLVRGDWETPATLNDTWGFKKHDHNWKDPRGLIKRLVNIVGKGGNYLLNVGPTALGVIPPPSVKRLETVGKWLRVNGEAVYGASASPYPCEPAWGSITSKPGRLYLHLVEWPGTDFVLYGLKNRVLRARLLAGPRRKPLDLLQEYDKEADLHALRLRLPSRPPDRTLSVVALEINGAAKVDQSNLPDTRGKIVLEAYRAAIHRPAKGSKLRLDRIGAVEGWFNSQCRLSWEFKAARAGQYDVVVVSTTERDGRWEGGHTIRVSIDGRALTGVIRKDKTAANPRAATGWEDVFSKIGTVSIAEPGVHQLEMKAARLEKRQKLGLRLLSLHLTPLS